MPQFDLAVFVPQLVWLTVFFAILYFGVVSLTLPRLGRVMETREATVTGDIAAAETAKADADRMAEEYDAGIEAARHGARDTVGAAKGKATAALEAKLAEGNAANDARLAAAEADLAGARNRALGEIEGVAADVAADIVERLTGARPDATAATAAARGALAA